MWLLFALACTPDPPDPPGRTHEAGALVFDGDPPVNLLMISIDTLRRDHVGRYAHDPALTPFLDELMNQGVPLDDLQQCSNWTFPSVSCTLGGRDHVEMGFLPTLDRDTRQPFPDGTPFLASWLSEAGYDTWLASVNGWLSAEWGTSQGYAHEPHMGIFHTEEIVKRAVAELEQGRDPSAPWFLHIHLIEPHTPYRAPASYMGGLDALDPIPWDLDDFDTHYEVTRDLWPDLAPDEQALLLEHLRVRYRAQVRWLDDQLAVRWQALEAAGLLDDTLVVFWSDHGEQLQEHGWQTHAYGLHGEELDAVGFFWARTLRPAAWAEPTLAIDLAPTTLAALDLPIPDVVTGAVVGTAPVDRPRFAHTQARLGTLDSVEQDGIKLIFDWTGTVSAFDRRSDPGETVDLWDPADPVQAALWDRLQERVGAESAISPELPLTWP